MKNKRVSIFIDGNNLYHSLNKLGVKEIDFEELIKILLKGDKLVEVFYYNASLDIKTNEQKYWKQQKFFNKLRNFGFNVKLGRLRKHKKNDVYFFDIKGDDVFLVVDLISAVVPVGSEFAFVRSGKNASGPSSSY